MMNPLLGLQYGANRGVGNVLNNAQMGATSGGGLLDSLGGIGGIGLGLSGLGSLGTALGLFESPQERAMRQQIAYQKEMAEREASRKRAMFNYLDTYLGQFQAPTFDPSKYEDVLQPTREAQGRELTGTRNLLALQGIARGGQAQRKIADVSRKQAQDYANLLTGLSREDYERALREYQNKANVMFQKAQYIA